jgi:hypothetical protein
VTTTAAPPAAATTAWTTRAEIHAGVLTMIPLVVGYIPFALVVGAAVAGQGAWVAGWAGSWLIYGGSAHLIAVQLLDTSGALLALATALFVSSRLLVYSASLGRRGPARRGVVRGHLRRRGDRAAPARRPLPIAAPLGLAAFAALAALRRDPFRRQPIPAVLAVIAGSLISLWGASMRRVVVAGCAVHVRAATLIGALI